MKTFCRALALLLFSLPLFCFAQNLPPLNKNAWNFIFVQSFEPNPSVSTNLSIQGFNHANLFGQLLTSATAGMSADIRQVYAWDQQGTGDNNMATLQSIEPFAVLNNLSVVRWLVANGDKSAYNSPAFNINNILANQSRGDYVIAMPADLINSTIQALNSGPVPWQQITPGNYNQYLVLSYENGVASAVAYEDGLKPKTSYSSPQFTSGQCQNPPVSFSVPAPKLPSFKLNKKQTVYFVRHVEAHPTSNFENGNFVCQGAWRANGANQILAAKIGNYPYRILTTDPTNIIACSGPCSYIRPALTISPFAIRYNKALDLAKFQWNDPESLAAALFTQGTTYSNPAYNDGITLVAWEHGNIVNAVKYLFQTVYNNPKAARDLPPWSFTDYDTIWVIKSDDDGNLSFSTTCEGIPSSSLPSTCPAFMP